MKKHLDRDIIEPARHNSDAPNLKTRLRVKAFDPDVDYSFRKSRPDWSNEKTSSDRLGPLYRFLRKSIGRPWNKVYSEICKTVDRRTTSGWHFLTHLDQSVEKNCEMDDQGYLIRVGGWASGHFTGFYVCPKTGLLKYSTGGPVKPEKPKPIISIKLSELHYLEKLNGVWFYCHYKRRDPNELISRRAVSGRVYERFVRDLPEKEQLILIAKKQANKQELKKLRKGKILEE